MTRTERERGEDAERGDDSYEVHAAPPPDNTRYYVAVVRLVRVHLPATVDNHSAPTYLSIH